MYKATIKTEESVNYLFVNVPAFKWRDIMCDNISLLKDTQIDKFVIMSFNTGKEILQIEVSEEDSSKINSFDHIVLNSVEPDVGADPVGVILKKEKYDLTGNFIQAIRAQAKGEYSKAIELYEKTIADNSMVVRAYNLLGLCYRKAGDVDKAQKYYSESMQHMPLQPEAYNNVGVVLQKQGQHEQAHNYFNKALSRDEFYYSSLMKTAQEYKNNSVSGSKEALITNLKLMTLYSELESVQNHLIEVSEDLNVELNHYARMMKNAEPFLAQESVLQIMRRIVTMHINGALAGVLEGLETLIDKNKGGDFKNQILCWCSNRLKKLIEDYPDYGLLQINEKVQSLKALLPDEVKTKQKPDNEKPEPKPEPKPDAQKDESLNDKPLTAREFFTLVLLEVMSDGKIEDTEKILVDKLKKALSISEEVFSQLLKEAKQKLDGYSSADKQNKNDGFNVKRLLEHLANAAIRNGQLSDSERKILLFAAKALNISSEELNKIISEQVRKRQS